MSEKPEDLQPEAEETQSDTPVEPVEADDPVNVDYEVAAESADEAQQAELQTQIEGLQQQLMRTHADFDNFRKRTRQEKEELQKFAARRILEELLPVLDNFERALPALADASPEVRQGMEMVHRQLAGVLQNQGVQTMDPVGQPFDPKVHEAVMQEPAEGTEPGTVVEVLQKGYVLQDKVLRPAMVKVAQ